MRIEVAELVAGQTNGVTLRRSASEQGQDKGQLYYTAHLATYVPVEKVTSQSRGSSVSREYRQSECYSPAPPAPPWMPPENQVNKDNPAACPPVPPQRRVIR